jgi:hypothetical protein
MTENEPALVRTALRSGPGIGKVVVNAAIAIHKALGSGLYEIVYEVILTHELKEEWFKC